MQHSEHRVAQRGQPGTRSSSRAAPPGTRMCAPCGGCCRWIGCPGGPRWTQSRSAGRRGALTPCSRRAPSRTPAKAGRGEAGLTPVYMEPLQSSGWALLCAGRGGRGCRQARGPLHVRARARARLERCLLALQELEQPLAVAARDAVVRGVELLRASEAWAPRGLDTGLGTAAAAAAVAGAKATPGTTMQAPGRRRLRALSTPLMSVSMRAKRAVASGSCRGKARSVLAKRGPTGGHARRGRIGLRTRTNGRSSAQRTPPTSRLTSSLPMNSDSR